MLGKWKSKLQWVASHIGQKSLQKSKSLQIIDAGEGVEKGKPSYTVGGNVSWYSHCGEQCGSSLKN